MKQIKGKETKLIIYKITQSVKKNQRKREEKTFTGDRKIVQSRSLLLVSEVKGLF